MFSQTLWYALGIYLLGIGFVLYIRPEIMFGPGGVWREFGLAEENSTLFPFWLFAIVWAVMSYAIATMIMIIAAGLAVEEPEGLEIFSNESNEPLKPVSNTNNFKQSISNNKSNGKGNNKGTNSAKPGYYVLNNSGSDPVYVFVGNAPPSEEMIDDIINKRF
jgi:hypothetical protein